MRPVWTLLLSLLAGCEASPSRPSAVAPPEGDETPVVTSEVMARAVYASAYSSDSRGLGGNALSDNLPRRWTGPTPAQPTVFLSVQPEQRAVVEGRVGMRVAVVNGTDEPVEFAAQDSMLDLVQEALDPETDRWRPIEYMPRSWCGNSYHTLSLPPGECWEVAAPRYSGPIATRLRFVLQVREGVQIISEPFAGGVHSGQFAQKQGHSPSNVMDPYGE